MPRSGGPALEPLDFGSIRGGNSILRGLPRFTMSLFGKKYECLACGMKFASEAELRRHGAVHTASKPSASQGPSCAACSISFRNEDERRIHGRQHDGM